MRLISDLKSYSGRTFQADVLAGLTVAVILVPQGMAYSMLAGLPPIYGLYAGLVPMLVYPWFASSRTLSVGPVALMSILLLSSLTLFAVPGSEEYLQLVLLTALLAGIIQVLLGVFKLGFLSNFLSRPVMTGFVSAAGVIIAISQIKYLFTLEVPRSSSIIQMLHDDYLALGSGNRYSLILGVSSFVLLILMKRWIPKFPRYLLVVVLGTLILYFTSMESMGVPIIGELKQGLPWFTASFLSFDNVINLFPSALVISLICFVGSYSIAETVGNSAPGSVSANKELIGLGMAKIAGSFFLSMPSTGSFTRSAVNAEAGAKTGMASIICAFFIGLTLLFFAPLFYYLPEPVLAAIVLASVTSLIKWKEAQRLWNFDRRDFWIMVITFMLTLTLGIVNGILSGIVLSLLAIIQRSSKPHFAELGRLPGTTSYRNIKRYPETIVDPQSLVLRYDQDLFFGNAGHFYRSLIRKLKDRQPTHLVLHLGAIHNMDSTAILRLKDFIKYCQTEEIDLTFTNLSGPIRDLFEKAGIFQMVGRDHVHLNVAHALLRNLEESNIDKDLSRKYARQNDKADRQ